jgi:UDP-N-acetylglucosamine acyltransferase
MSIHPTAVIAPGVDLDPGIIVGPFVVIDQHVTLGAGVQIGSHSVITGHTSIGKNTKIGPFAHIGGPPQDLKYHNEDTRLVIGDNNDIREYVSIHRGTPTGHGVTTVGDNNLIMAYCHIAHDCVVGNNVIMANAATLGGHVEVADRVTLGGLVAVHQFSRIGTFAYIGGLSGISRDVPPYVILSGTRNQMRISGINKIGLRRNGLDVTNIKKLEQAFKIIFRTPGLLLKDALEKTLAEVVDCDSVTHLVQFIQSSQRGVVRAWEDE